MKGGGAREGPVQMTRVVVAARSAHVTPAAAFDMTCLPSSKTQVDEEGHVEDLPRDSGSWSYPFSAWQLRMLPPLCCCCF